MEVLYKHAKNFLADKNAGKPALEGIYFDGKSAMMSDGYLLFKIKNYPSPKRIMDIKTGLDINETYPEVDKVIPTEFSNEISFAADLNSWQKKVKICTEIVRGVADTNGIYLGFDGNKLQIQAQNPDSKMSFNCELPFKNVDTKTSVHVFCNAKHLMYILAAFKDMNDITLKMKFAKAMLVFESERALAITGLLSADAAKARYGYVTA